MNRELVGNVIEQAIKVSSFRKAVREACRKKGLEYPSDEKIAEWIEQGYLFNINDFIKDYTEKEGIFRTPLDEFKAAIDEIQWGTPPTEEEIFNFFNTHGNDINLFCYHHNVNNMHPLERKVFLKTIATLRESSLVALWNAFIEESEKYGQDSRIFDMEDKKIVDFLERNMNCEQFARCKKFMDNGERYIQWYYDDSITAKKDIKHIIACYWSEIFERLTLYPSCYNNIDGLQYFLACVWPIILKESGIEIVSEDEIKFCK